MGGSCRILPNITQDIYEKWMSRIKMSCDQNGSFFQIKDYKRPFRTSDSSILIKTAQSVLNKMKLEINCLALASTNEASLFSRVGIMRIFVFNNAMDKYFSLLAIELWR